jgi:hypothetical protein
MTEEELNQIKAATYDAAWRGGRNGAIAGSFQVLLFVIGIAIFIWLFWYGGFSKVFSLIVALISIIFLIISALPKGTFVYLGSIIFVIFILAILWSIGKAWYVAKHNRNLAKEWHITPTPKEWPPSSQEWHVTPTPTTMISPDKLKIWREYK